jgi:hypothetical protein
MRVSIALFFFELFFFLCLSVFAGCFCRAMKNAMKKRFAIALSHSTFVPANLRTLRTSLQALFETASRKTAAPQQSQKRAFALHSVCTFFDLLIRFLLHVHFY